MKRSGKMEPASEALREAQDVLRRNDAFQFWLFRQRWPSFVGEVFAEESYIARRDGALLCIYATNSVWMQELLMRKAEILRRIREDPYGAQFRDLRVQIGPRPRALRPESPVDRLAPLYDRRKSRTPLTEGEEAWISRWADAHVARDELRGPIEELMRGALRRRKDELAAGWHPCARCGDLCPAKDRLCARCEAEEERQTRSRIVLLLKEKPELLYDDVRRAVHVPPVRRGAGHPHPPLPAEPLQPVRHGGRKAAAPVAPHPQAVCLHHGKRSEEDPLRSAGEENLCSERKKGWDFV